MNKAEKSQKWEIESSVQPYMPHQRYIGSALHTFHQTTEPAGRYRTPEGIFGRLTRGFRAAVMEFYSSEFGEPFTFEEMQNLATSKWQVILNYLFDQGIVSSPSIVFESIFNDEPRYYSFRILSSLKDNVTDGVTNAIHGYSRGVSTDPDEAISKVIGELLERYPLLLYRRKDFLRSSIKVLRAKKRAFLDINHLAGFANWQKDLFPQRQFNEGSVFYWVEGEELLRKERTFIPAQLIFWNYRIERDSGEPFLRESNTNGAAGHFTREEAILAGIYENIQRDAFLIHWLNSIAPPRINIRTIGDDRVVKITEQCSRYGLEVLLLNTTLDLAIPSCVCILLDHSGKGPKISLGGGCDMRLSDAIFRSITEALGVRYWLRAMGRTFIISKNHKPFRDQKIHQSERLLLYENEETFNRITSFLSSGPMQSFQEIAGLPQIHQDARQELQFVLNIFRKLGKGYEVYAYEVKHEILEALGYHSVKVVIPALIPLYLTETNAPLGASRLREIPVKMGYQPAEELNPWPHPFP